MTLGTACTLLGWWLFRRSHPALAGAVALVGILLLAAGLAVPADLGQVYRGWMGLARRLSRVTAPVLMALIYFALLTPVGLLLRVFGRDPLRPARRAASLWRDREGPGERRGDLKRQF